MRSIEFSPVARDSAEALTAASQRLNVRQRASVRSVQQLRLSETPGSVEQFRALMRFDNLRSLSLWRWPKLYTALAARVQPDIYPTTSAFVPQKLRW